MTSLSSSQPPNESASVAASSPCEYFKHEDHTPSPEVVYVQSHAEAEYQLSRLRGPVLGFDVQWHYSGQWDTAILNNWLGEIGKTALIQICDENLILLIHLKEGTNATLPPRLVEILQDHRVYKSGVQVRGAGQKLFRDFRFSFPLGINSLLELSNVARSVDPANHSAGNDLLWPAYLVKTYTKKSVDPAQSLMQVDWSLDLKQQDIQYAANQVYSSLQVYLALQRLATQRAVSIDRDACSNNIDPEGKHYRGLLANKPYVRSDDGTGPDGGFLPLKGHTTLSNPLRLNPRAPKYPHTSQETVLEHFRRGLDLRTIASECHLMRDTVELKLCYLLHDCRPDTLNREELRRLIPQLQDPSILKTFGDLILELKLRAGEGGQEYDAGAAGGHFATCAGTGVSDWQDRKPVGALPAASTPVTEPLRSIDDVKPETGARSPPPGSPATELPRTPLRLRPPPRTSYIPGTPLLACSTPPTPHKYSAVRSFIQGNGIDTIAFKLRVKRQTAENYLFSSLLYKRLPDSLLSKEDVKRLGAEMKGRPKYETYKQCMKRWRTVHGEDSVVTDDEEQPAPEPASLPESLPEPEATLLDVKVEEELVEVEVKSEPVETQQEPEATYVEEQEVGRRSRKRAMSEPADESEEGVGSPTPAPKKLRQI